MEEQADHPKLRRVLVWAVGLVGVVAVVVLAGKLLGPAPSSVPPAKGAPAVETTGAETPDPRSAVENFNYCFAQLKAKAADLAVPACLQAVLLQPENIAARHNLGFAYRLTGQYDAAIGTLEGVIREEPGNIRSLYELGSSYADSGRTEEARTTFRRLLELDPAHSAARQRLSNLGG